MLTTTVSCGSSFLMRSNCCFCQEAVNKCNEIDLESSNKWLIISANVPDVFSKILRFTLTSEFTSEFKHQYLQKMYFLSQFLS